MSGLTAWLVLGAGCGGRWCSACVLLLLLLMLAQLLP